MVQLLLIHIIILLYTDSIPKFKFAFPIEGQSPIHTGGGGGGGGGEGKANLNLGIESV